MADIKGKVAFLSGNGSSIALRQVAAFAKVACEIGIAGSRDDHPDETAETLRQAGGPMVPERDKK